MNSILVLTNKHDFSSNEVIKWIKKNTNLIIQRFHAIDIEKIKFRIDGEKNEFWLNDKKIMSVWFRKSFHFSSQFLNIFESNLKHHLNNELIELRYFLYFGITYFKVNILGKNPFSYFDVHKLKILFEAKKCGLKIPPTFIGNRKEDLLLFMKNKDSIVSKPMANVCFLRDKKNLHTYSMYTKKLSIKDIEESRCFQFPSLIQEYIDKLFDIRIFYLSGRMYSAAIHSQSTKETIEDFRNYGNFNPSRTVPFNLEETIKENLIKLMNSLGLDTGSIDMVYSKEGEIFFLEVNPVGQFGMISEPCNFGIEKTISKMLI